MTSFGALEQLTIEADEGDKQGKGKDVSSETLNTVHHRKCIILCLVWLSRYIRTPWND